MIPCSHSEVQRRPLERELDGLSPGLLHHPTKAKPRKPYTSHTPPPPPPPPSNSPNRVLSHLYTREHTQMVPRSKRKVTITRGSEVQSAARMTKVQFGSSDSSDNGPKRSSPTDLMRQFCKPPTDSCEYLILGERRSSGSGGSCGDSHHI